MKFSKVLHVGAIVVGAAGVVSAIAGITAGRTGLIWGFMREHLLLCAGLLVLFAIWAQIGAIHHLMLEKKGEWL